MKVISRGRRGLRVAASLAVLASAPSAAGFTFPEHVRITQRAVRQLRDEADFGADAPYARLAALWSHLDVSGQHHAGLCATLDATSSVVRSSPPACVSFADLPALAGDHSCTPSDLDRILDAAGRVVDAVGPDDRADAHWVFRVLRSAQEADRLVQDQGGVPGAIRSRPSQARLRIRADLNLQLTLDDPDYVSRAAENVTHFLPERASSSSDFARWVSDAMCADRTAGVCASGLPAAGTRRGANGVSSYVLYHHLAVHLARDYVERCVKRRCANSAERGWQILRAEAFALHFLEDAFSSGHAVGVPLNSERRNGLHDLACGEGVDALPWTTARSAYRSYGDGFMQPIDEARAAEAVAASLRSLGGALAAADVADAPPGARASAETLFAGEVEALLDYDSCDPDPVPWLRRRLSARLGAPEWSEVKQDCTNPAWRDLCLPLTYVPRPATVAERAARTEVSARGLGLGLSANLSTYWDAVHDAWAFQGTVAFGAALDVDSVLSSYRDSLTLIQAVGGVEYRGEPGVSWLVGFRLRLPFAWGVPVIGWLAWGPPLAAFTTNAPAWAWQRSAAASRFPWPLIGNPLPGRHLMQLTLGREATWLWRFSDRGARGGPMSPDGVEVQVPVLSLIFRRPLGFDRWPWDIAALDLGARVASVGSQGGFEAGLVLSLGTRLRYIPAGPDLDRAR